MTLARLFNRTIERFDNEDREWELRFVVWRMRWFPYRVHEWLGGDEFGPARWQWPDVLGRRFRE